VIVAGYNGRWLRLTIHGDCVLRAVTDVRSHSLLLPLGYVGGE